MTPAGELYCARCASLTPSYDDPIPWEQRGEIGWGMGLWGTLRGVFFSPVETLRRIDPQGPWLDPILFLLITSTVVGLGVGVQMIGQTFSMGEAFGGAPTPFGAGETLGFTVGMGVGAFFLVPLGSLLGSFVTAGLLHLCAMIVGGAEGGYRGTWRVIAYINGIQVVTGLLMVLAGLGGFVHAYVYWGFYILSQLFSMGMGLYVLVLWVLGLREVHRTTTGRALGAVGIFFGAGFLLCCGAYALIVGAALFAFQGMAGQ